MALQFSSSNRGIERLSNIVPASSDYTACWFQYLPSVVAPSNNITLFVLVNDAALFTEYVWVAIDAAAKYFIDTTGATSAAVSASTGWHHFAYTRTGTTHRLYVDGLLVTNVTFDSSSDTFNEMYLGTDTISGDWGPSTVQYFREWDTALSAAQILVEAENPTPVHTSNLWSDTPLVSDLLDDSGNGYNWSFSGGTSSFVAASFTPGSYNNWYVNNVEETPYLVGTTHGGWNAANNISSQNVLFDPRPQFSVGESITPQNMTENNATNPYEVCLIRLITLPLATQTISGSINMVLGLLESNSAADFYTKVYAWVTVGDSDTNRGTLLDYEETIADTEWPTTAAGVAFTSRQALNSIDIADGDRIVIEFGFRKLNASATLRTGTLYKGSSIEPGIPVDDLTVGSTNVTTKRGFFNFLIPPVLSNVTPTNVSWDSAEILTFPVSVTIDPVTISINLWYKYTADGSENGGISIYAGVSGAGDYLPHIYVWSGDDVTYPSILQLPYNNTWLNGFSQSIIISVEVGTTYYIQVYDDWALNPPGRDLVLEGVKFPTSFPVSVQDKLFIPVDQNSLPLLGSRDLGSIFDTDGTILWMDFNPNTGSSEYGAVFRNSPYVGNIITGDQQNPENIYLRDSQLNILDIVTVTNAAGDPDACLSVSQNYFYAGQQYLGVFNVRRFTGNGSPAIGSWMITTPSGWVQIRDICPNNNDNILYILATFGNLNIDAGKPIKTYNLNTNSFDADFYALGANENSVNMWGLADGTFVIGTENSTDDEAFLVHLDSNGTVIDSYDLDSASDGSLHHIIPNADEDAVWTWQQKLLDESAAYQLFTFKLIQLSDGTVLNTITNVRDFEGNTGFLTDTLYDFPPTGQEFGPPGSCPFLVMLESSGPPPTNPASGIYKIQPNSFKSNDTLWVSFDPIETEDVEIPRPFARTGLLGE